MENQNLIFFFETESSSEEASVISVSFNIRNAASLWIDCKFRLQFLNQVLLFCERIETNLIFETIANARWSSLHSYTSRCWCHPNPQPMLSLVDCSSWICLWIITLALVGPFTAHSLLLQGSQLMRWPIKSDLVTWAGCWIGSTDRSSVWSESILKF